MKLDPSKIKKVLVIGLSCIGDMLLTTGALSNLRSYLDKDTSFTLWVPPRAVPAVEDDPLWNTVEPYDRGGVYSGFKGRLRAIKKIRRGRYDLVIDLRATLLPLFSGARYAPLVGLRESFLPKKIHEAERNLNVMGQLGVPVLCRNLRFHITSDSRNYISARFPKIMDHRRDVPFVIFNPGGNCGPPSKCWPASSFAELGKKLVSKYNAMIGVIGYSPEEEILAGKILDGLAENNRLDMSGSSMELGRLAAAMEKADLFVTNDTGTIHLASAVGLPTVGLYGPSRPERYGPWCNRHRIVVPDLPCAPCRGGECSSGLQDCMSAISVNNVFSACEQLL
jgi:heptosyltransferase-2